MLPITITGNIDVGFACQRQQNTKCLEPVNEKHTKAPLRVCGYGRIGQRQIGRCECGVPKIIVWLFRWRFLHPRSNINKMSEGHALNDEDRAPWLSALNDAAFAMQRTNDVSIIVCSALKNATATVYVKVMEISLLCIWMAILILSNPV